MNTSYAQESRFIAVHSPLGEDVLLLTKLSVEEQISHLFSLRLDMLSREAAIDPAEIVGKRIDASIRLANGSIRYFNGFVSNFSAGAGAHQGLRHYWAEVVPWLWFLDRTADCRIFQNKCIPEILEAIFTELGFTDFDTSGIDQDSHSAWDYCVQYRETDFNFVSRLMEQEGIFYWFRHERGRHTLIIGDQKSAYQNCSERKVQYVPGSLETDHISDWQHQYHFRSGQWAQRDYDFKKPKTDLLATSPTIVQLPEANQYELYDYPGEYLTRETGVLLSDRRMEEEEMNFHVLRGTSTCRNFSPGCKFQLSRHDMASEEGKNYLVTRVRHTASDNTYVAGPAVASHEYLNDFDCIPAEVVFRPPRVTPVPYIRGPQTAVVVGPAGDEIYTDDYGRIKLQFHWDRYGEANENSSCWVRVAQVWAGKMWGGMMIPRVGQEVIVDFLEGDPDRPIVIGRVYNAEYMPPYDLPDYKAITALKSNSTRDGQGFNEIRFDDTKGGEQIFIHAEKNEDVRVKEDCYEWIGKDRHLIVKKDQLVHVENNRHEKIDADHKEEIGKDRHLTVKGKEAKSVDASKSLTVKGDVIEVFKADHSEQVANDYYLKAENIVIEAVSNITLKVGGSHVAIEASGIKIGSSGTVKIEAGGNVQVKGALIELN